MNKFCKILLAAAAVTALAAPAMAADKLIVKDAAGTTDVFKVTDAGNVTATGKVGVGLASPFVNFHLHVPGPATPAGTLLYNVSSPFTADNQNTSVLADFVVADATATAGNRGAIRGIRSRGSLEVPTVPLQGDLVLSIIGAIWDGAVVRNTADINFAVDGAVSSNVAPQSIAFRTRTGGAGAYFDRLTIKNDGKIILGTAGIPVFADNTAAASLAAGTLYRTATGVLMIKF